MLNGLLNIGHTALTAAQAWISVTGSNIANADTEGYTRRYVDQRDGGTITTKPGGESLGVNAQQVLRYFDAFLESSYVRQSTNSARWSEQETIMSSVENLFNESNRTGISSTLTEFFTAWSDLAQRPDDTATRESLLSYADSLGDMLGSTVDSLKAIQSEMDVSINQGVDRVNALAQSIADLNKQINARTREGVSNPNDLLDQRDQMVRELAGLVDVQTTDNGGGDYTVRLSTGQPLVQGQDTFDLQVLGPRAEERLTANSSYAGSVQFDGTDSHEYTLEIVNGGAVGDTPPPSFRVSLDGGKTWLRDEDGNELRYTITDNDGDGQVEQYYNDGSEFAGLSSGSNNYAPSNPALTERVEADIEEFLEKNPGVSREDIPTDLMTASGSGLDPHISPASAEVQIPRIVEASGLSEDEVRQIIADNTKGKTLGVFGEETVNVLGVNLDIALAMGLVGEISK